MGARFESLPAEVRKRLQEQHPELGLKKSDKNKFGAKTTKRYGLLFRSDLELYQYESLKKHNVEFDFQFPVELHKSFRTSRGQLVRGTRFTIDFRIKDSKGQFWYVDTKGVVEQDYVYRWKEFVRSHSENFLHIRGKKEADALSILLRNGEPIEEFAYDKFEPKKYNGNTKKIRRR